MYNWIGCYYSCGTCSGPENNNCLTCTQHSDVGTISREFVNSQCVCPLHWYDDGSGELCKCNIIILNRM